MKKKTVTLMVDGKTWIRFEDVCGFVLTGNDPVPMDLFHGDVVVAGDATLVLTMADPKKGVFVSRGPGGRTPWDE